ncbi:DnaJ family domain-containing protein [Apirhabdus apintestini]|uniref:DnaJ family domain-containing protein n=1 Tax=Erwinia sp. HR93 TaxID=3094840 RepID=UPI002ADEA99F|nr:DnaJ family domain-containing protein [Erwinia sp. HR93]MEA1063179.1 DnaJ family domain-containing protein [Erwinia sp. HR93]WPM84620.1 DnaJ family domain-containing protein [Enterobacteriaceae bacterium CA-0114]
MSFYDGKAERRILDAQRKGGFDDLPSVGQPITLDDDSHIPSELRTAYRILKNTGYLPAELELRKQAVELNDLLENIHKEGPDYVILTRQLRLLELRLKLSGQNTDFLHGEYRCHLVKKMGDGR